MDPNRKRDTRQQELKAEQEAVFHQSITAEPFHVVLVQLDRRSVTDPAFVWLISDWHQGKLVGLECKQASTFGSLVGVNRCEISVNGIAHLTDALRRPV